MYRIHGYVLNGDKFVKTRPGQLGGSLRSIIMALPDTTTAMVIQHGDDIVWQAVTMSKLLVREDGSAWVWDNIPMFAEPEAVVACLMIANEATVSARTTKGMILDADKQAREKRQQAEYDDAFDQLTKYEEASFDASFDLFNKISTKHQKE